MKKALRKTSRSKPSTTDYNDRYPKRTPDDLAVSFIPLVKSMASSYSSTPSLKDELESAGYIGLVVASRKYDHKRGTSFSKYARFWIKKYMMESMTYHCHPVTISANKVLDLLREQKDKSFDAPENEYKYYSMDCESLSGDVRHELSQQQKSDELPDAPTMKHEMKATVKTLMKERLNRKERDMICRRMGMGKHEEHTLEDLGKIYGVTREAIRMSLGRAYKKLRYPLQHVYHVVDA